MSAQRSDWLSPSAKLRLCALIRETWAADASLTVEQVMTKTKAPKNVVKDVRKRLVKAGKLPAGGRWPGRAG